MFGPNLKGAFQISPPKIGQFVSNCRKGYKFQILLAFFCLKVSWLNQKAITGVWFCNTKGPCKHYGKTECCFRNQPPENLAISLECVNRVQISNLIGFFVWKVNCLKQSFSQQLYFVTLKGCGMCWPKLKAGFQVSAPKIGKFLWRRRIGSKFQILLLSFLWNVSWLNQKTFPRVSFYDTEGLCKHWSKTKCFFPNQTPKNWSIYFELTNRIQIWNFIGLFFLKGNLLETKLFRRLLFCDTEGHGKLG